MARDLLPAMQAAKPRPALTFTYDKPSPPPSPDYRLVLVIAGAILVVLYLIAAIAMLVWFISGLVTSPEAMSMVFVFWLFALLMLTPVWVGGIALLGSGRARQRGPVAGAVIAWILAIGGFPAIGAILMTLISFIPAANDSLVGVAFAVVVIGIPVLALLALLGGAWLTWGKPSAA